MKADELVNSFKELRINLKNSNVINLLEKEGLSVHRLTEAINKYISNEDYISDESLINTLLQKTKTLIQLTNEGHFERYVKQCIPLASFIIESSTEFDSIEKVFADGESERIPPSISEEEFSNRYDLLVSKLNIYPEESNLILETPAEKRLFKVFKNTANTIVIRSGQEATPMSLTKETLMNAVYQGTQYRLVSYGSVIISKIMDNSIFDHISATQNNNLTEALKEQVSRQATDIFLVRNDIEKLQKAEDELAATKEELSKILLRSQEAESNYLATITAADNAIRLNLSVDYWKEKQIQHQKKFYIYGVISIILIFALIVALKILISNHNTEIDLNEKNISNSLEIVETNPFLDKNISQAVTLKSATQDNNKDSEILTQNSLAYIHFFGWYALLIFASSSILWIIRIVVKIALSNLHLSEDAHERVVMIQTYLAFIKEGHGLEENDKQLILSSLFRPSNIGIIKDESSITVADIVSSLKAR